MYLLLKLTGRHEASRGFSATAKLLVYLAPSADDRRVNCFWWHVIVTICLQNQVKQLSCFPQTLVTDEQRLCDLAVKFRAILDQNQDLQATAKDL